MVGRVALFAVSSLVVSLRAAGQCPATATVQAPLNACKSGTATAIVAQIPGATYAWTVEGGEIVGDAGSDQVTIALGTGATATVSVTATSGSCVAHASSTITLHDPFAVHTVIPTGHAAEPLVITWSYENGAPAQQAISGTDFGTVTLAPETRSYTYSPSTSGSKQFVIDALMQTPITPSPSTSKRRAVSKSPYTASTCVNAHTESQYDVSECIEPPLYVNAPQSVATGTKFQLSVVSQPGAVATWTIRNGSPATATGDSVMVTAGAAGTVDFSIRLTRGLCAAQRDSRIAITGAPACNPTAVVSAGLFSCGAAVVNATFTGTPPFHGTWSDNVAFSSSYPGITRTVTVAGNYSITSFADAACAGTSSGVAVVPLLTPTATVTGNPNSCVGLDSVTVQFRGKPPFAGYVNDTYFNTSSMQLVAPVTKPGMFSVGAYDSTGCSMAVIGSVMGVPRPQIYLFSDCLSQQQPPREFVGVDVSGTPPYSVTMSDGTILTGSQTMGLPPPLTQPTTFTAVSGHDAFCPAVLVRPSVTVYPPSPPPNFQLGVSNLYCITTGAVSLATPPPVGATVVWNVVNGTIVSGQGTSTMQYNTGFPGTMQVSCSFTYGDQGCTTTTTAAPVRIDGAPVGTVSLAKPQIYVGDTVLITFTFDNAAGSWNLSDSKQDNITVLGSCSPNTPCQALYTSSHGTGQSTVTLEMDGYCGTSRTATAQLTIVLPSVVP
jgi:hypothetical protein